jgi:2-polyprenyl-3-methyl-5-hydroxy-6-metoxy-1,4-benzoquinol methylase
MNGKISDEEVRKANKELHDVEAQYYDILHGEIWNFYEQSKIRHDLRKIAGIIKKETLNVLDVGAGTGNLTLKFLASGNTVTALDISEEMLKVISNKVSDKLKDNVELVCGDVDEFLSKTEQKYDVICFSSVLHHLPDYFYTLDLAISKLRSGGVIYITHEPLRHLNESDFIWRNNKRVISLIDSYLNRLHLSKYRKLDLPNLDYTTCDIHSREGINSKELFGFLWRERMKVVFYKEYEICKSGIMSIIGNFLIRHGYFKLIIKMSD